MSAKKVEEVMVPISEYPVIYGADSLNDAILMLKASNSKDKGHRSLLVFCKVQKVVGEERLIGIITVGDIIKALKKLTSSYDEEEMITIAMSFGGYDRDIRNRQEKIMKEGYSIKVRDNMKPLVNAFVQSDQALDEAVQVMMNNNVQYVPVFKGKKAVGVLRALDILDSIGDVLMKYSSKK